MSLSDQKLYNLKNDLIRLINAGQFKKAEKLYLLCKDKDIEDADLWRLLAGVHSKRGNLKEIVHCCRHILKINPNDYQTAYNMGAALQNLGRTDEAIQQYENCIATNPDFASAYANCAHLYYLTGNSAKSVDYFRRALEKHDSTDIRMQYGQACMASGDNNNAIQQFKYILSKNPAIIQALFFMAQCYYESQNYIESEKYYLKLLELDRNNVKAINNLGRLYEETGNLDKAIEYFQEAILIDDQIPVIHRNLGKALVKHSDLNEAEKEFLKSKELEPEHPETYFNLGKLYSETHDIVKAKEHFTKALSMDIPEHMEKAEEFILAAKYFLSSIDHPDTFNDDKKAFVADLFDGYADKFDEHLVEGLKYRTPEIINNLLTTYVKKNDNSTLDLGCGTGLCCKYLRYFSNSVIGVDLSSKMIDKAQSLDCYDKLIIGEITEVVNNLKEYFDLIVAADVFVYIGSLQDIFEACRNNITNNGYFVFSTEILPDDANDEFRLFDSGRYKHTIQYINNLSSTNNFTLKEHHKCILRKENGIDVEGNVTILQYTT